MIERVEAPTPESLVETVNTSAIPMVLADLPARVILAASEPACDLIAISRDQLVGRHIADVTHESDWPNLDEALDDLTRGVVDSYQATRRYLRPNGDSFSVVEWTRRVWSEGHMYALNLVRECGDIDLLAPTDLAIPSQRLGLLVTDHDWRIERTSPDAADLLGVPLGRLRGTGFLGLLAPTDVPEFLSAASRAGRRQAAFTVEVRTSGGSTASAIRTLVLALCSHEPARLGIVLGEAERTTDPRDGGLHHAVAATVHDERAAGVLRALERLESARGGSVLTARQWEMVARVARGESVSAIADAIFLSPSTVRNHLSVVYRKLGIHSKAELLALLLKYSGDAPRAP